MVRALRSHRVLDLEAAEARSLVAGAVENGFVDIVLAFGTKFAMPREGLRRVRSWVSNDRGRCCEGTRGDDQSCRAAGITIRYGAAVQASCARKYCA